MRRLIPAVMIATSLGLIGLGEPVQAQPRVFGIPDISGVWYMNGDPYQPCEIRQRRGDGRALFTNENGSAAWATVRGDQVWIPAWTDGRSQGLSGIIRGDRIIWPNGTFWSR